MPIHPSYISKLVLLEGIQSFEAGFADPASRARMDEFFAPREVPPAPDAEVVPAAVPGPHGPVPVRVYRPQDGGGDRPALVWMHGGAFRGGDLDMLEADWVARAICAAAGALVVSVDYRLAVDGVSYPVPHDDVVAAVRWVRDSAGELGIDPTRISVGGASAGGNLAAGAVLRIRDDDSWRPANLILAYATMHAVLPPPSPALAGLMAEVPPLLRFLPDEVSSMTRNYVGGPESQADGYAMPANAILTWLCPVLLLNAEYDDLRTSSEAFAAQLAIAGVDVRQVLTRSMLHGFLNLPGTIPPVRAALDLMAEIVTGQSS